MPHRQTILTLRDYFLKHIPGATPEKVDACICKCCAHYKPAECAGEPCRKPDACRKRREQDGVGNFVAKKHGAELHFRASDVVLEARRSL